MAQEISIRGNPSNPQRQYERDYVKGRESLLTRQGERCMQVMLLTCCRTCSSSLPRDDSSCASSRENFSARSASASWPGFPVEAKGLVGSLSEPQGHGNFQG